MDIIKEILKLLPEGKISVACFEGANIVLYTKDRKFFIEGTMEVRKVVGELKKRIELRADPSITHEKKEAEAEIKKLIPEEAGVGAINFDEQRSIAIIEADKPGLAIGKQGALLKEIRAQTFWTPLIRRMPPIKSQLIEDIRAVLFQNSEYRRKFLDQVGHRIYDGWLREKKQEWVRISWFGGGRQVGRSCLFLQTPESRVLIDCGINVATYDPVEAYPILDAPEFDIQKLDAVIITHSHMDHAGFLPYLYKFGYTGPVYCTEPTRDIMSLLALDYVKIVKSENRDPIFDGDHIKEMVKHTICLDYGEVHDITPDVRLTFYNSGHILGSTMAHLHIGNGLHNLLYTSDMKFGRTMLLEPAIFNFPRLETMIIEGTYGARGKILPSQREEDDQFKQIIKETVERKGKILIPVLGVGRAQEVMLLLESMIATGELPKIPVYIDGMVWDITAIHTAYPEYLNSLVRRRIFHKDQNPFLADCFKRVGSHKERLQVIQDEGSCVVLATSGMLVGGPSVEYLRHFADSARNTLIFTSFQGEGSLGRRIQQGEKEITWKEGAKTEITPIRLQIHTLEISGHSDRKQLMSFVYKCTPKPKKIIINHGEAQSCLDLASSIHQQFRIETAVPRNLDCIRLR